MNRVDELTLFTFSDHKPSLFAHTPRGDGDGIVPGDLLVLAQIG